MADFTVDVGTSLLTMPTQSDFPDICLVNGTLIESVGIEQLLEVAHSVGIELKRRSIQEHHDMSAALSMRVSGSSLVEAVRSIRATGERIANSEFSEQSRTLRGGRE